MLKREIEIPRGTWGGIYILCISAWRSLSKRSDSLRKERDRVLVRHFQFLALHLRRPSSATAGRSERASQETCFNKAREVVGQPALGCIAFRWTNHPRPSIAVQPDRVPNLRDKSTSLHFRGFHRHCRNALMAQESSIENPVDLITITSLTEPVFTSTLIRNKPLPPRCRDRYS